VTVASFLLGRVLQPDEGEERARLEGVAISVAALFAISVVAYGGWDFQWIRTLLSEPGDAVQPNGHVIAGVAALFALWVRGVQRGTLPDIDFESVLASASFGLVAVLIAALTTPDVQGGASWGALAFAYAVVAMLTLAVFNASPKTALSSLATGWPLAIVGVAGVVLAIALIVGTAGGALSDPLSPLMAPVEAFGRGLRDYVLAPIIWLVALPVRAFVWLLSLVTPGDPDPQQVLEPPAEEEPPPEQDDPPLWFRVLLIVGSVLGGAVVALVALWLLWRAFRRYLGRRAFDPRETREDLPATEGLGLGAMLGTLGRRFRRNPAPHGGEPIRRLYFDVLAAGEDRGTVRPPGATPLQFAPALDNAFSSRAPTDITEAFVESRYAERNVDDERVRELRQAWTQRDARGPADRH
jgi:hypothetical protein